MKKIVTTTISPASPRLCRAARDRFELGAERVAGLQVALGQLLRLARLRLEEAVLEAEEGDDREEADADEGLAGVPVRRRSAGRSRPAAATIMPGRDQIAIDLLHPRRGSPESRAETAARPRRRTRSRRSGRRRARPRGCAGTARSCSRDRRSSQASAETYLRPAATEQQSAAQSPSRRRSASARPAGRRLRRLVQLSRKQSRADEGGGSRGRTRRSNSGEAPASPPRLPSAASCRRPP